MHYIRVYMCVCFYVCMYVCAYVYMDVCLRMCVRMCVRVCVDAYITITLRYHYTRGQWPCVSIDSLISSRVCMCVFIHLIHTLLLLLIILSIYIERERERDNRGCSFRINVIATPLYYVLLAHTHTRLILMMIMLV